MILSIETLNLLSKKKFAPFFWTQFLGALNDNIYKQALITYITFQLASQNTSTLINLASALFILPFFLFSSISGEIADKFNKKKIIYFLKILEIILCIIIGIGFYINNLQLLLFSLFLLGLQSALFGPVKYSILPEHLDKQELVGGNGFVEMGTFIAILIGTVIGNILIGIDKGAILISSILIALAVIGWLTSIYIPAKPSRHPNIKINWNIIKNTYKNINMVYKKKPLFLTIIAISWFWLMAGLYLTQLPYYTKNYIGASSEIVTLLITILAVGVAIGSMTCDSLTQRKLQLGIVPFGALGIAIFSLDLSLAHIPLTNYLNSYKEFFTSAYHLRILGDLLLIGIFSGFYLVPLYTFMQVRSASYYRSRVIAANNIMNAALMVIGALFAIVLLNMGVSIAGLFIILAIGNILVAIKMINLLATDMVVFCIKLFIRLFYNVSCYNANNIPKKGPAVIVCNHISYIDALIIIGISRRKIRFLMDYNIYHLPIIHYLFKSMDVIPIPYGTSKISKTRAALNEVSLTLERDDIVALFPEGELMSKGKSSYFKRGIEEIIKRNPVPVIPIVISGLWGSFFSRCYGQAMLHIPRKFRKLNIKILVGKIWQPSKVTATDIENYISENYEILSR